MANIVTQLSTGDFCDMKFIFTCPVKGALERPATESITSRDD